MSKSFKGFNIHFRPRFVDWIEFRKQPEVQGVWSNKRIFHIPADSERGWLIIPNVTVLRAASQSKAFKRMGATNWRSFVANELRERFPKPYLPDDELKEGFHFKEFVH